MDAELGYSAEGGNQMCMLGADTPEGLHGSGHRCRSEGSSVGSLWSRRGGTMVSEKGPERGVKTK